MSDYEQMARVIHYMNDHFVHQPSLQDLASVTGLSTTHFQKKFTSWTGISPKAFVQTLTFNYARNQLETGGATQETSDAVGLSGSGRLHDLCIKLVAATPGEIKTGGTGLNIDYGFGLSPFGQCFMAISNRGIVSLEFVHDDENLPLQTLKLSWPHAVLERDDNKIEKNLAEIFSKQNGSNDFLNVYVKGSKFQLKIWQALLEIPIGQCISYSQLANKVNNPKAARAAGNAVGANTLAYIIPCHRVIRETGVIGHYRWGSPRKKFMLAYETSSSI